jgi:hypothetical protein
VRPYPATVGGDLPAAIAARHDAELTAGLRLVHAGHGARAEFSLGDTPGRSPSPRSQRRGRPPGPARPRWGRCSPPVPFPARIVCIPPHFPSSSSCPSRSWTSARKARKGGEDAPGPRVPMDRGRSSLFLPVRTCREGKPYRGMGRRAYLSRLVNARCREVVPACAGSPR